MPAKQASKAIGGWFVFFLSSLPIQLLFAHEVAVHQSITQNAEASAFASSLNYANFLSVISTDIDRPTAIRFMVAGSAREDDSGKDSGGNRSYNHFYDPLDSNYGKGLSDFPTDLRVLLGSNSFSWGSISNCVGYNYPGVLWVGRNENTTNIYSWQNARYYEWVGLTASDSATRNSNLTIMFRSVGQVMHLLEDTSQPQHVRNEQHVNPFTNTNPLQKLDPWASPIEAYGLKYVDQLNYSNSVLDWWGSGFRKLEDFWDRHTYRGNASALSNDASGGTQLGLAEWCNGNFLGVRHLYAEYYPTNSIKHYPYPSRSTSTDFNQRVANISAGIHSLTLRNGHQGQAMYLAKTGDGIQMPYLSRFTYFGSTFLHSGLTTVRDDNVLSNYHNVLIPKAVNYAAGLIDYYFRGTLDIAITNITTNFVCFQITNTSSQDFHSGSFHLFYDDTSQNRHELSSPNFTNDYSGSLAAGGTFDAAYVPNSNATQYILVYQGTIGTSSGTPYDPIDTNIAVAVKAFSTNTLNWNNLVWSGPFYSGMGTALASVTNNQFNVDLVSEATGAIAVTFSATMSYTGPSVLCNDHIIVTGGANEGDGLIQMDIDGTVFYGPQAFYATPDGTYDYPFTVPHSSPGLITIRILDCCGQTYGFFVGGYGVQSFTVDGTLTPAY